MMADVPVECGPKKQHFEVCNNNLGTLNMASITCVLLLLCEAFSDEYNMNGVECGRM